MPLEYDVPFRFGDAWRAMNALFANPDDTAQVFRIIEALSGNTPLRSLAKLRRTVNGREMLHERPQVLSRLVDHETLRKLPDGTLGREYLRFLESEGITAEGLLKASADGRTLNAGVPEDLVFLRDRMRDTHDLWHVVTGYKGDLLGEAALLAFTFAQTMNPGIGFMVAMILLRGREPSVRKLVLGGFRRGVRSIWLPAVEWERLLALPLDRVRRQLRIDAPPRYETFRTSQLFATAA